MKDFSFQKIFLCTDFSDAAKNAENYAMQLVKHLGVPLHVIHVFDHHLLETPLPYHTFDHSEVDEYIRKGRESGQKHLEKFCNDAEAECNPHFLEGKPAETIVKFTNDNEIDLMILGTHGYTGLEWLVMGSVAEHVISRASCPVLTIKSGL